MKKNKIAGFWIRLSARIIDLIFFGFTSLFIAFFSIQKKVVWEFKEPFLFYVWSISTIIILFLYFCILPLFFGGKTIGMFICRIKIKFKNSNKFKSIFKRELFFSLTWLFLLVLVTIVINHTLISKYASTNQEQITYSDLELLRKSTTTTIGGIFVLIQMICAISIVVKKPGPAIHDQFSETETVWIDKYSKIKKQQSNEIISIRPKLIKQEIIEWI